MITEKMCTKCKDTFPIGGFHLNTTTRDGRQYWCKRCTNETKRKIDLLKRSNRKPFIPMVSVVGRMNF